MSAWVEWRWTNVPLPETYLIALAGSLLLHRVRPRRIGRPSVSRPAGAVLLGMGVGLAAWATRAAGKADLDNPDQLITGGPYDLSRNPMYVGWSLIYLGWAFLLDRAWPLILLPGVAVAVHEEIAREERRLEERFGSEYRSYARQVRRYL